MYSLQMEFRLGALCFDVIVTSFCEKENRHNTAVCVILLHDCLTYVLLVALV